MFSFVSEIAPNEFTDSRRATPEPKVYLTFDLDWCHEEVLADTLDLIETYDATGTFFCTDRPQSLDLLRGNSRAELGIHPNFRPLFSGNPLEQSSAEAILDSMLELVPEGKSVRSHSLISGSNLTALFASRGLTHESNMKIPLESGCHALPFRNFAGTITCPFHWGDYTDLGERLVPGRGASYLMVNFHPIHIFLNTENLVRYELSRPFHFEPKLLRQRRYAGYGVRSQFIELLESLAQKKR